jgi:hypothetical protein
VHASRASRRDIVYLLQRKGGILIDERGREINFNKIYVFVLK